MNYNFNQNKSFSYKLNSNSYDNENCILKFSNCDKKFPLWNLNKTELKAFISFAKKIENLSWKEIKFYDGFNYEPLPNLTPPSNLEKDITLHSMRISQKFRIIGYRLESFFYIVWFDKNHITC